MNEIDRGWAEDPQLSNYLKKKHRDMITLGLESILKPGTAFEEFKAIGSTIGSGNYGYANGAGTNPYNLITVPTKAYIDEKSFFGTFVIEPDLKTIRNIHLLKLENL
jgi:hypothetical protein